MSRPSAQAARWGLLLTTLAMAAALVGTGVSGYLGARATSASVTRSAAMDMVYSVRRGLRAAGGAKPEALQEILTELDPQGLRFVGVQDPDGRLVASAGVAATPSAWLPPDPVAESPGPRLQQAARGNLVRLTSPLLPHPGGGRRMMRWMHGGPGWWPGWMGARLVLELEPVTARGITSRALANLLIGLIAAAALLAAAVVFWRQSVRAEQTAAQRERDRQLTALGQMSAVLGHELRNPLASLKGHAQLLLEKLPADHPGRRGAETVVREAVRLEELASQVLEFVRTGTVTPAPEDPLALARAAIEAAGADGRVRLAAPAEAPTWPLDRARMEAVLVNLLRNALSAGSDGAEVELEVAIDGERRLVFEVRDRGEGITPGDEEKVFEPFYTRRARGTGLGLAVARRIVEGHGGSIEALNRPGGGAVFRVSLPRA